MTNRSRNPHEGPFPRYTRHVLSPAGRNKSQTTKAPSLNDIGGARGEGSEICETSVSINTQTSGLKEGRTSVERVGAMQIVRPEAMSRRSPARLIQARYEERKGSIREDLNPRFPAKPSATGEYQS